MSYRILNNTIMKEQTNLVNVSEYVIGRTPAYYQDEDDFVFTPNYWVCCPVLKIDKYIAPQSPIYRLTPKGEEKFDDWEDAVSCGDAKKGDEADDGGYADHFRGDEDGEDASYHCERQVQQCDGGK